MTTKSLATKQGFFVLMNTNCLLTHTNPKSTRRIFMHNKLTQKYKIDLNNLPQNPNPCMIVPDVDDLWDEESFVSSSGMS